MTSSEQLPATRRKSEPRIWLETRVVVPRAAAEPVASYLTDLGSPGLAIEEDDDTICLVAYFAEQAPLAKVRQYLQALRLAKRSSVATRQVTSTAWSENWKQHFPPLAVGKRLYVCPPWDKARPAGRIRVVINPGMAFGTGHHATTRGGLELLERWLPPGSAVALDLGTGSGILAVALALLGVPRVVAVDTDPDARAAAAQNASRNGVASAIEIRASIDAVAERRFPLLVANLRLDVFLELHEDLAARSELGSTMIVSGLLGTDRRSFNRAFGVRWRECDRICEGEWISLALRRQA